MRKKSLPLLLTLFLLITIPLVVWATQTQRLETRKKAQEKEEEIPISRWVPIDLAEFSQNVNQQIKELNSQLLKTKGSQLTALQQELKIQQLMLAEYQLMDENKDGQIDYNEFNQKTVWLADKIYQLRHAKIEGRADGLYDSGWRPITKANLRQHSSSTNNVIRIIVEAFIYEYILDSLEQYRADIIQEDDYQVLFYLCHDCTYQEIKELLKTPGTIGTVFVGDLPSVWFKMENCWTGTPVEYFPSDLYFMDFDDLWLGEEVECGNQTCFTVQEADQSPEIFFGRLTVPNESQQIELLNHYFAKNHQYRQNRNLLPQRSLNYIDDDWFRLAPLWAQQISVAYPIYDLVRDKAVTNGNDFKSRWDDDYEHLYLAVHSSPFGHYFSSMASEAPVHWGDVRELKPHFHFYNLMACSAARFTTPNYIAGWYAFQKSDYGLAVIGSTKIGAMLAISSFYQALSGSKNFGTAMQKQLNQSPWIHLYQCWNAGLTLIGDPTLKISRVPACANFSLSPFSLTTGENLSLSFTTKNAGERVYYFNDEGSPYPPGFHPWLILGRNTQNNASFQINFSPDPYEVAVNVFNKDCNLVCAANGKLYAVENCGGGISNPENAIGDCQNDCHGRFEIIVPATPTPTPTPPEIHCESRCSWGKWQCERDNADKTSGECQVNPQCPVTMEGTDYWRWSYCW